MQHLAVPSSLLVLAKTQPSNTPPSPHHLPRRRARGWARLGAAQLCLGHSRAALSAYQRGLQLDPDSVEMQRGAQLAAAGQAGVEDRRRAMRHADGDVE